MALAHLKEYVTVGSTYHFLGPVTNSCRPLIVNGLILLDKIKIFRKMKSEPARNKAQLFLADFRIIRGNRLRIRYHNQAVGISILLLIAASDPLRWLTMWLFAEDPTVEEIELLNGFKCGHLTLLAQTKKLTNQGRFNFQLKINSMIQYQTKQNPIAWIFWPSVDMPPRPYVAVVKTIWARCGIQS